MKQIYDNLKNENIKKECADVISVLAMTMGEGRECLKYRLLSEMEQIKDWGHEYVRQVFIIMSQYVTQIYKLRTKKNVIILKEVWFLIFFFYLTSFCFALLFLDFY